MGNSDICSDINDIEELQSEEGDAPIRENANPIREDYNFIREQNPILGSGLDLIGSAKLPMLFLDSNLLIEYISAEANSLFRGYYHLERKPFFNVFGNILSRKELEDFFSCVRSHSKGFTWRGTMAHKIRAKRALYTRTSFIPLSISDAQPSGYIVLFEDISDMYSQQISNMLSSLLQASKLKDNETGLHCERVNHYCRLIAEYLYDINLYPQVDTDFVENIAFLAAMHDVGKIGIPDYVLKKRGGLNELEWELMKEDTINGALILSSYPDPMAKEIALSHHERWDGTGYPFKLEGEMIPLSARITSIADVYDALRMERSYKKGFSHEQTTHMILEQSGKSFDPILARVFQKIHTKFNDVWDTLQD